jgi:lipoprotein-anchoring transpeptidase ErfK/SrfK
VTMSGHHRRRIGRWWMALIILLGVVLVGAGGAAYAAYRYEQARAGRILPGVRVEGVDVGGMTRQEALGAVTAAIRPRMSAELEVRAGDSGWTRTREELGLRADVGAAVNEALSLSGGLSWMNRAYYRLADKPLERSFDVAFGLDPAPAEGLVAKVARRVGVEPVDASFALEGGRLVQTHSEPGAALRAKKSISLIQGAVESGDSTVELPMKQVDPAVSDESLGKTLVVDVSKNKLSLYDGFAVSRTYSVATAKRGYLTPTGRWTIVNKVMNPSWYNPAPTTWGKDMPLVIGPGPTNPLGTRALYLDAPGIRIHGSAASSSIGTYASHGCIRMHISESEALYPLIPIGTPVFVIGAPPWGLTTNPGAAG